MLAPFQSKEKTDLSLREITERDVDAVSELAARIWREHYVPDIVTAEQIEYMLPIVASAQWFRETLKTGRSKVWLLFSGNALAGYIAVKPEGTGYWFIDKLYVDIGLQRGGLGRTLLEHAERQLSPAKMILRVNRKNFVAVNFYFKHGFTITRTDEKDIGGGFVMDDFIMEKSYE